MKKKTILLTTLAGTMLVTGLTLSGVNAATKVPTAKSKLVVNAPEDGQNAIIVELMEDSVKLTKEELTELIEAKYKAEKLTVEDIAPVQEDGTVGTGAVVTLNTGKKFTVILYGDTTGDGKINVTDARAVLENKYGTITFTKAESLAANVLLRGDAADTSDARRIFEYAWYTQNGGYEDTEYAEWYEKVTEVVSTPITLSAKKIDSDPRDSVGDWTNNTSKIEEVVLDGNTIKLKFDNLETKLAAFTNVTRNGVSAKWYRIEIGTGLDAEHYTVSGAEVETTSAGKTYLWLKADQGTEVPVTITNLDDPTEIMNVTVQLVDCSDLTLKHARKLSSATGNDTLINSVTFSSATAITVNANVNSMTNSKINEVDGRWFKLELIVDKPYDQVMVISNQNDKDGNYVYYKTEDGGILKEGDAQYVASEKRYSVIVYLNGLTSANNICVLNKEATAADVANAQSSGKTVVEITNDGRLQLAPYIAKGTLASYDSTKDGTGNQGVIDVNTSAVSVTKPLNSNKVTDGVIEVSGELNKMIPFKLDEDLKVITKNGVGKDEAGKKLYPLAINLGNQYKAKDIKVLEGENIYDYNTALKTPYLPSQLSTTDANGERTKLIWLDASVPETTFKLQGGGTEDGGEYKEVVEFTVKFIDKSKPDVAEVAVAESENSQLVTAYEHTTANKINVNARLKGMTETTRINPLTGEEVKGKWFALRIKTTVARELLGLDVATDRANEFENNLLPANDLAEGYTDLANDEIVLWVNGTDEKLAGGSRITYTFKNVNDQTGATVAIQVGLTDTSTLKLDTLANISNIVTTNKESIKTSVGLSEDAVTALATNVAGVTVSENAYPAYKISVNVNTLKEFAHPTLGTGKWLVLNLGVGTTRTKGYIS